MTTIELGRVKLGTRFFSMTAKELPTTGKRPRGQGADGLGKKIELPFTIQWLRMNGAVRLERRAYCEAREDGNSFYVLVNGQKVDIPPLF